MISSLVPVMSWLLVVAVAGAALKTAHPEPDPRIARPSAALIALWLLVALPSVVQFLHPPLLAWLQRDWHRIEHGQVWRLVTSVVVQDGGLPGFVFNLFAVIVIGIAAGQYWSGRRIWLTFWGGAVASNLAVAGVEPVGGGSSMASFVLGCALLSNALLSRPTRAAVVAAAGALACVVLIGVGRDYHALACLIGLLAGLVPPYGPRASGTAPGPDPSSPDPA